MGDISGITAYPAPFEAVDLSLGWSFKQTDHVGENSWYPVKKVPSTVHQDLIDNKKYVRRAGSLDQTNDPFPPGWKIPLLVSMN